MLPTENRYANWLPETATSPYQPPALTVDGKKINQLTMCVWRDHMDSLDVTQMPTVT